jgi:ligand-binding sensor domain-containing protein/signal transduction histidine kinase
VLLALVVCARSADALDPARTLTQYVHRIWQVQQGLPQASIDAIVQTHDGYLWLGTQTGLVRFDGARFTTVDDLDGVAVAGMWITELVEDTHGTLWIGTNHAGVIKLQHGKATRYHTHNGLPSDTVQCLFADPHENVWVCTPDGLAEITRDKIKIFGVEDGLPSGNVRAACGAANGTVYVGMDNTHLATLTGTRFELRPLAIPESAGVQAMLCARDGALWIGTSDGLLRVGNGAERRLSIGDGLSDNSVLTLMETEDGAVLAGTKNGFSRVRGGEVERFRPDDGLSQSTVYSLYEDREGSLWVATKHGLNQFLDGRAVPYTTSEGLPSNHTGPVFQDRRGTIWVGTLGGGLAHFDGHKFTSMTERTGLASDTIRALAEDGAGDLFVGTSAGLNRLHDGRVTGTWTTRDGLPDNLVRALYLDRDGTLWIATPRGAATFRAGAVHRVAQPHRRADEAIATFAEDRAGLLHAAPDGDSPSLHDADALYRDRAGLLWIGTLGEGLRLVDGDRIVNFSVDDGLFDDVIYGIMEDDYGRLWMACSKGIFSVSRADLLTFASGKAKRFVSVPYSPLEALRTIECQSGVQPAIAKMQDGRLWFSTIRGVLVVDPTHLDRHFLPPAVAVEDIVVDGERTHEITSLPHAPNNLEFNYTGVSFVAPTRIAFRYKLEGFDKAWVDAGQRRQAFYTNLPPGRFRFRVAACNPGDACNESPAVLAFVIQPRLYQRAWFFPLFATVLAFGGWGLYQLRIRRLREQFDLILAERGRIARELHDTLIQGFSGITMAMQAVVTRLPASSRERRTIEDIVTDAGQTLQEARRSLTGLRAGHDAHSLATALGETARQLTAARDIRLKLHLADCPRPLSADVEYNLLRIAQEAVSNAAQHASARAIEVSLVSAPPRLVMSVSDDGTGFDAGSPSPAGHYGLIGMRERAAHIGAELFVKTAPGRGTTVEVVVMP